MYERGGAVMAAVEQQERMPVSSHAQTACFQYYYALYKDFVDPGDSRSMSVLESAYVLLQGSHKPGHVMAAGSAAVELALVQPELPMDLRMDLIEDGAACWQRVLDKQRPSILGVDGGKREHERSSWANRVALNLAVKPVLKGMVEGNVSRQMRREALKGCLSVAHDASQDLRAARRCGEAQAQTNIGGFILECIAHLAVYGDYRWVSIPALARSDSGDHDARNTHDILAVLRDRYALRWCAVPVEAKSSVSAYKRSRYKGVVLGGPNDLARGFEGREEDALLRMIDFHDGRLGMKAREEAVRVSKRVVAKTYAHYVRHVGSAATQSGGIVLVTG